MASQASPAPRGARPPAIRYTHDALIDLVIAQPWISQNDIAKHFGYTPSWVSTIMTSDAFKAKLEIRKDELVDPAIRLSIEERFKAVTSRSLEVLMDKLSVPAAMVSDSLALQAAALGAKSLGMGQPKQVVIERGEGHLDRLAERLVALGRGARGGEVVDAEVIQPGHSSGVRPPEQPSDSSASSCLDAAARDAA